MRLLVVALMFAAYPALADTPASARATEAPAQSVWRPSAGGYEHLQTGLICPTQLAGYRRTEVVTFDDYGLDVGCNYSIGTAALTFYLTRRDGPGGLEAAIADAKRDLLQAGAPRHAQLISETASVEGDLKWDIALYAEDGDLHSAIWIADLFGWTFEYRATYPASEEARTVADIRTITTGIRSGAGARLQLCARAPQPARPGKAVTDAAQIKAAAMMSSILGGAIQEAAEEQKGKPDEASALDAPPTWCVERATTRDGFPMVFWRGVRDDATNALDDRITLATQDHPPVTLDVSAGGLAGLIEAESKKDDKPEQWTASLHNGDQVLIFGYFAGRPSADLVADLFARVLSGKQKPVGGYSAKGKTITIIAPEK
jgi:hypothetical protein